MVWMSSSSSSMAREYEEIKTLWDNKETEALNTNTSILNLYERGEKRDILN